MAFVEVDVRDEVGYLRLNRPERLNALSLQVLEEFQQALDGFRSEAVRAIVLTGTGRAFSAGADVKEWASETRDAGAPSWTDRAHSLIVDYYNFPVPKIAAVNGLAFGAGCDFALASDIRIAHPTARFCEAYIRLAIPPDVGGTWLLPRVVGEARALEIIISGREVGAPEAERIGLVNVVTGEDDFWPTVEEWATRLAHGPTAAIRLARDLVRGSAGLSLQEGVDAEGRATDSLHDSHDHREALQAQVEKRPVTFLGH
ncbi:MAG: enoyl-CoA hydratase/isomerase family protein [Clostridia bacterium]